MHCWDAESEVHIFYDLHRIMEDNVAMMVSVNGATLSRDRITPDAIIMVTANARGNDKIVWHTYFEGREALPDPAFCYDNGIDITNPGFAPQQVGLTSSNTACWLSANCHL